MYPTRTLPWEDRGLTENRLARRLGDTAVEQTASMPAMPVAVLKIDDADQDQLDSHLLLLWLLLLRPPCE